jgi:hypothetical protein
MFEGQGIAVEFWEGRVSKLELKPDKKATGAELKSGVDALGPLMLALHAWV